MAFFLVAKVLIVFATWVSREDEKRRVWREEGREEGVVWHAGRETEAMIGERGPARSWVNLPAPPVASCARVIVCVKLTTQRPTRLYCCLSPQQKLSGGYRLAAALISALFPSLWDPLSTHSLLIFPKWIVTNAIYSVDNTTYNATIEKVQLCIYFRTILIVI